MLPTKKLWAMAEHFMAAIWTETGFPVLIYNDQGYIVRATDKSRIGDLHAGARKIMQGQVDEYAVTPEEAARDPLVREGYNCPIVIDGQRVAAFGITGKLEQTRPLAKMAVRLIDAWITDQKHQDELERSEHKFRSIFDHSPQGIFQTDLDGRMLTANPALARMYGYPTPEALVTELTDVARQLYVHPADRQKLLAALQAKGRITGFLTRYRRRDGQIIDVSVNAHFIDDPETGEPIMEGIVEDITDRKRAEEALKLSEEKYFKAFDNSPVWVVLSSLETGRYIEINQTFMDEMGYGREEIVGRTSLEMGTWVDSDDRRAIHDALEENGTIRNVEVRRRTKSGRVLTMLFSADIIEISGESCMLSVSLDISDRKAIENERQNYETRIQQMQKMEAIGMLAGGIAHDFNNILSAVIGYAELALMDTEPEGHLQHSIQQIHAAGMRARELVQQILTFSRQGKRELKPLKIAVPIKEALKLLRSSLPATIDMTTRIDTHLDNVMADPTQIHQIIMNLCTNAAQAMEKNGGQLTVTLSQVTLDDRDIRLYPGLTAGDYIKLGIQDTGIGISDDLLVKIYQPYFTTKGKGKGTGLGLAVVHGIVQSYGGGIHVESVVGKGTTFHVYLPTIKAEVRPSTETTVPPGGTERIFFIDDEAAIVDLGRQGLERLGYTVEVATDCRKALAQFREASDRFDLIITDMTMPRMTGDQLAAEFRKLRADIPIIACTGYSSRIDERKIEAMGIRAMLMKPVKLSDLARCVRQVLDHPPTGR